MDWIDEGFHYDCARKISRIELIMEADTDRFIYPSTEAIMEKTGLLPIEKYIEMRREKIREFAKGREIYVQDMPQSSGEPRAGIKSLQHATDTGTSQQDERDNRELGKTQRQTKK